MEDNPPDPRIEPNTEGTDPLDEQIVNFTAFASGELENISPDATIIMVMGTTGTGKSSFISACTGREDVKIGHDLMSCTNSIGIFRGEMDGHEFYLIDTPGFDDNRVPDYEILNTITTYLSASYVNGIQLNGVVYFHLITETRINRSIEHNIDMFKAICGEDYNANLAILTNMWMPRWKNEAEQEKQKKREEELKSYVPGIIDSGGQILQQEDCSDPLVRAASSQAILKQLLEVWKYSKITLQIQSEMADEEGKTLGETTAGQVLQSYVDERADELRQYLANPQLAIQGPHHGNWVSEQRENEAEFQRQLNELGRSGEEMRANLKEVYEKERSRVLEGLKAVEDKWAADIRAKEDAYRLKEEEGAVARVRNDGGPRRKAEESLPSASDYMTLVVSQAASPPDLAQQLIIQQLARIQEDIKDLRKKKEKSTQVREKVEGKWIPILEVAMTGAFTLAGAAITSGMLCVVQ